MSDRRRPPPPPPPSRRSDVTVGQPENEVKADLIDTIASGLGNAWELMMGECNYGNFCGAPCTGNNFADAPVDELDAACRNHDWCLDHAADKCVQCGCDQRLVDAADEVRAACGPRMLPQPAHALAALL